MLKYINTYILAVWSVDEYGNATFDVVWLICTHYLLSFGVVKYYSIIRYLHSKLDLITIKSSTSKLLILPVGYFTSF